MTHNKQLRTSVALFVITLLIIGLVIVVLIRQLARSPGTLAGLWLPALELLATSLLALAISAALIIAWYLPGNIFSVKVRTLLSSRTRKRLFGLVVLGFLLPAVLSLFNGALLPPASYLWELWLSVIALASIAEVFWFLVRRVSRFRELIILGQKASQAAIIQDRLPQIESALDEALIAVDHGTISLDQVKEIEQTLSLAKWMLQGDDTGRCELQEEVRFGDGLRPRIRTLVDWELQRVRQEHYRNGEYQDQLQSLLSPR